MKLQTLVVSTAVAAALSVSPYSSRRLGGRSCRAWLV